MKMEIPMMVILKMRKLMVREYIITQMDQDMKDSGKKIRNMEKDRKHGQMVLVSKEIMKMAINKEQVSLCGLMEALMRASFLRIKLKDKVTYRNIIH